MHFLLDAKLYVFCLMPNCMFRYVGAKLSICLYIIIIILSPIGHLALADGDMVDLVLAGGQALHL